MSQIDYQVILADLRARRDKLDGAIKGIEELVGAPPAPAEEIPARRHGGGRRSKAGGREDEDKPRRGRPGRKPGPAPAEGAAEGPKRRGRPPKDKERAEGQGCEGCRQPVSALSVCLPCSRRLCKPCFDGSDICPDCEKTAR